MEQNLKVSDPIPVSVAAEQTANWRNYINNSTLSPLYGFYIPLEAIQQVTQNAVAGVRIYLALSDAPATYGSYLVPMDANGNDILTVDGNSVVFDTTMPCPNMCGTPNALNSDQ